MPVDVGCAILIDLRSHVCCCARHDGVENAGDHCQGGRWIGCLLAGAREEWKL
jgi:hypothetical protein